MGYSDNITHPSLIGCQLFVRLIGGQTLYTHPWLNVGGGEARSSGFSAPRQPGQLYICQRRISATRPVGASYTFCARNLTFFPVSSQLLRSLMEGSFIFSLFLL